MLELPRQFLEEIVAHAREEAPNECCGILAGKDGRALKLFRAANAEHSPYRYNVDPQNLYRIYSEVDVMGWEFVAIYHSHPTGEAYPSPSDVAESRLPGAGGSVERWPGAVHVIVSLAAATPQVRAFRLAGGDVSEEMLLLID